MGLNNGAPMSQGKHRPYAEALPIARYWSEILKPYCDRLQIAGSLRREASDIGDIEFVVIPKDKPSFVEFLTTMGFTGGDFKRSLTKDETQIEVYMASEENWGACLLYATGPKNYTIRLRALAKNSRGMLLNEKGLFSGEGQRIAGRTEEEILSCLRATYRPPKERIK